MTPSISEDLATALDPVLFAQSLGIDPDPWQCDLLLSAEKRIMLNCSRQSGKTTIVATMALHHALNNSGALVLVLSPSLRQSGELFKKISGFYDDLNKPIPSTVETALTLQLANKSRIVSLPGKEQTIRGFSGVSLLIIDEAARVNDYLYYAARPMLAVSGGRLILLSTPYGQRGFFFKEWSEGEKWKKIKITADQCPRITREFLAEERVTFPDWYYFQEYHCVFTRSAFSAFRAEDIESAFSHRRFS